MGNTVSAAELAANQIVHHSNEPQQKPDHHNFKGEIPPECPMHKSKPASPVESGCPVQGDVNPLNMVFMFNFSVTQKCKSYWIFRWGQPIRNLPLDNHSHYPKRDKFLQYQRL